MRRERLEPEAIEHNLSSRVEGLGLDIELGLEPPRSDDEAGHDNQGANAGAAMRAHCEVVSLMFERGDAVADVAAWWGEHVGTVIALREYRLSLSPSEFMARDWSMLTVYSTWRALSEVGWSVLLLGPEDPRTVRAASLIDAGTDRVVDLVMDLIAPGREVAAQGLHERPYGPLLKVLEAPAVKRAALMGRFVKSWYNQSRKLPWFSYHTRNAYRYSGYWCVEAAMVCVLLDIDDSGFRDNEFYPAELADYARGLAGASRGI